MNTGRNLVLKMPQVHEACRLYESGLSFNQVAIRLGCSHTAVESALRVMGKKPRTKLEGLAIRHGWHKNRERLAA